VSAQLDPAILDRYEELLAAEPEPAEHCEGELCFRDGRDISACLCNCSGCERATVLLILAREDVLEQTYGSAA
jgi:hypothetical protein